MNEKSKPPLKWAGGKRWLTPLIQELWKRYDSSARFVEPFCGGLAITLGILPEDALLNDINPHAINFYKWLQKGLVIENIEMVNEEQTFYKNRALFNSLVLNGGTDSQQAAELFYYLNHTCYNGLCRFNNRGEFNAPFGKYKKINYMRDFLQYRDLFKFWNFINTDFEDIELSPDDFVYADPPYDVEFTKYSKEDFRWNDQVRLVEWLSKHEGIVVISNQATERIIHLYEGFGFHLKYLKAPRLISCTGDRSSVTEVLAVKLQTSFLRSSGSQMALSSSLF